MIKKREDQKMYKKYCEETEKNAKNAWKKPNTKWTNRNEHRESSSSYPFTPGRETHRKMTESMSDSKSEALNSSRDMEIAADERCEKVSNSKETIDSCKGFIESYSIQTGRSRGFGFVYFDSIEDAKVAHVQANGIEIGDRRIRVDYSATEKPHDPTPGVYYGKVSYPKGGGGGAGYASHGGGGPPLGPPAPVAGNMAAPGGYYHCRACEIEARERERWEREARRYGNGSTDYYYQDKYAAPEQPRTRDRSAMSRSRNDYYRGGAGVR